MELVNGIDPKLVDKIGIDIMYIYLMNFCFDSDNILQKIRANAVLTKSSTNYLEASME